MSDDNGSQEPVNIFDAVMRRGRETRDIGSGVASKLAPIIDDILNAYIDDGADVVCVHLGSIVGVSLILGLATSRFHQLAPHVDGGQTARMINECIMEGYLEYFESSGGSVDESDQEGDEEEAESQRSDE